MDNFIYLGKCDEKMSARDPFVFFKDGFFYHLFSLNNSLWIKKAVKLEELVNSKPNEVFHSDTYKELWAPELHVIDGKCYIYVAMDDGDNYNHRMYVLENNSSNPLNTFKIHGMLKEKEERWAIDGSLLTYQNKLYFIWSGWEGKENIAQNIYIQEMSDPFTLVGKRSLISRPDLTWERLGSGGENKLPTINEGPFAIYGEKNIHIIYSASGSWCDDYCLGLLTFKGGDILEPNNWEKTPEPILKRNEKALGPGHASFFIDPTTSKNYVVYHLFNTDAAHGWNGTHAMIQEYKMINDYPVLDKPVNYFNK